MTGTPAKNRIDIVGQRYGRLFVTGHSHTAKKFAFWHCVCDCGGTAIVRGLSLKNGTTKSCGCLLVERGRALNLRHGMRHSPTWASWCGMKSRCSTNTKSPTKNYSARGISVCERWMTFENFIADMGEAPAGASIERINNDLGYYPENCRWASRVEQNRNRRNNVIVEFNGERRVLSEWVQITGIKYGTLYKRIVLSKWPVERAFT